VNETDSARIRIFLNDPAGRGDRLAESPPPEKTEAGPWGFRVEGTAPVPRAYEPDTREFLYWQLSSALERGKRLWARRIPAPGVWIPGPVLPAVAAAGQDLNAYYDRKALRFFRDVDAKTGRIVQAGESPDVVTHEQGHAILDAIRPDLWDAPHFEVAAFHEAFGDLAAIFVALAEPVLADRALKETRGDPARSNLVSRLAEELGAAVRVRWGADAALPGALRDAVNTFTYTDPKGLPDMAPAQSLSAEPHSFCRVLTGACWDVLVAIFRATAGPDRSAALVRACERTAVLAVAAAETAPSGADFFGRFARRIVREQRTAGDPALAPALADAFFQRGLLASPEVPAELFPDQDPGVAAPPEGEGPSPALVRAIETRLGPARDGELLLLGTRGAEPGRTNVLRGRRRQDLFLHGAEYGPADGAAVEISDAFALGFTEAGLLAASRVHRAEDRDANDARAFVRFLARHRRIAQIRSTPSDSQQLARAGHSHAVVLEADGVRRLRRAWIARKETP
jgi:hypothetical protein